MKPVSIARQIRSATRREGGEQRSWQQANEHSRQPINEVRRPDLFGYTSVLTTGLAIGLLVFSQQAVATYSIVAADNQTKQVGGAVTSCIRGGSVARVYSSAPGVGAIHAQAYSNEQGRDAGSYYLANGYRPAAILNYITSSSFDSLASYRQYGIATFDSAVGYTGTDNSAFAADLQGQTSRYTYSVQGNLLTSSRVLTQSEQGFRSAGCDLADKLMRSLEAGALNSEGDARCRPARPSDAAFIQIDRTNGEVLLRLDVSGAKAPIKTLRAQYDQWRRRNPCPSS
jgi:uncharacterized Ntn-hydrolase superfamily protein